MFILNIFRKENYQSKLFYDPSLKWQMFHFEEAKMHHLMVLFHIILYSRKQLIFCIMYFLLYYNILTQNVNHLCFKLRQMLK